MRKAENRVVVAEVVKPHGIRGEICIHSFADSPSLFGLVHELVLEKGGRTQVRRLQSWREHQGRVLVRLEGVADRNAAEDLRGWTVLVDADALPEVEDDEVYLREIIGFAVQLADGTSLGELSGVIETPGQDTWTIDAPGGSEILLPAVPEFVLEIDMDTQRIVVDPPEGLLDLYLKGQPGADAAAATEPAEARPSEAEDSRKRPTAGRRGASRKKGSRKRPSARAKSRRKP